LSQSNKNSKRGVTKMNYQEPHQDFNPTPEEIEQIDDFLFEFDQFEYTEERTVARFTTKDYQ
jgi:hypothetical protein